MSKPHMSAHCVTNVYDGCWRFDPNDESTRLMRGIHDDFTGTKPLME